jgi:hypothetical protein
VMSVSYDSVSPTARSSKKQLQVQITGYKSVVTAIMGLDPDPRPATEPVSAPATERSFRKFKGSTMTDEKRALVRASIRAYALNKRALRELGLTKAEPSTDVEKQKQRDLIDATIEKIKRRDRFALGAINAVECRKQDDLQDLLASMDCWSISPLSPEVLAIMDATSPKH